MEDGVCGPRVHAPETGEAVRCVTVSAPFSGIEVSLRNLLRIFSTCDDVDIVGFRVAAAPADGAVEPDPAAERPLGAGGMVVHHPPTAAPSAGWRRCRRRCSSTT